MDFAGLQVGDVIRLDSKIDDEMEVYVGNIKNLLRYPVQARIIMLSGSRQLSERRNK